MSSAIRCFVRHALVASLAMAATGAHAALTISTAPTSNVTCSAGTCAATAPDAVLNVVDLKKLLARSDASVASGPAGSIRVDAALGWTHASRLTLAAAASITVSQPVLVEGPGAVTLTTSDTAFKGHGRIEFWDLSDDLVINGASYTLVGDLRTLAADIWANPSGNYALARSYDAAVDGVYHDAPITTVFYGTLDGLGNSISRLKIDDTAGLHGYDEVGLLSFLMGTLRNLGLIDVNIVNNSNNIGPVGALVGEDPGVIVNCFATGRIASRGQGLVGGLVGEMGSGTILNSHASVMVSVSGYRNTPGGLVGMVGAPGMVSRSYATGPVRAGGLDVIGGLAGGSEGTIVNSYATGAVTGGKGSRAGGLAGANYGGTIQTSYSTGAVAASKKTLVGGIVGDNEFTPRILQSVWDTTTSGVTNCAGYTDTPVDCTGLTTEQMKSALPPGFDPAVWALNPSINNGYPYLIANPPR
jgi:hypothetical protein